MAVISVSRQYGAKGLQFGQALAKKLGYRYVDRQVMEKAAEEMGVTQAEAHAILEGHRGAIFDLVEKLSSMILGGAGSSKYSYDIGEHHADYLAQTENMILMLAEDDNMVLVGCGGQVILKEIPRALHVRLVADRAERKKNVMEREGCTKVSAGDIMDREEKSAKRFMEKQWDVDRDDPALYDMVLNYSRLGQDACLAVAEALIQAKGA